VKYYSSQFSELNSTIKGLKKTENDFKKLFSLGSKEKVLEKVNTSDYGNIDIEKLKLQIGETIERVGEIKDYLHQQKNIYLATPKGLPAAGTITSPYGIRKHPITGKEQFHPALDIKESPGSLIKATADGIVSFSGWDGGSGNIVVLEHGFGFSTLYGHTKKNTVTVGQKVKRGDVIGYIGSTGYSTGPHVHYEVWKEGRPVDPEYYN
jgi:murein DD-endopeptidase MepM/ murein hydrolase activator NlpD